MNKVAYAINEKTITCVVGGNIHTIQRDHPEAHQIIVAIKENWSPERLVQLFDKIKAMSVYMDGKVEVRGNSVFYNGKEVHNVVTDRITRFMSQGLPHAPLVKFLERIQANPSMRSVEQLYSFLEHKNLPITPDGTFLAYKAITNDWKDKHTRSIPNTIGSKPQMARNKVDDDPNAACSFGYHVGSLEYVTGFASGYGTPGGDRIVIVEVDPADVVSVPHDCSCQKVRTCAYKVVAEYTGALPEVLVRDSSLPYDDDEEDEEDDEEYDFDPCAGAEDDDCDDEEEDDDPEYKSGFKAGVEYAAETLSDLAEDMDD